MTQGFWRKLTEQSLRRRRLLVGAAGTTAAAMLLAACGRSKGGQPSPVTKANDTSKQARRGGVLKHYVAGDPTSFDPAATNIFAEIPRMLTNNTLTTFAPGYLRPAGADVIPDLAESWEFSPDKTQLTFKLRQGVRWHNKAPVNGRLLDMDDVTFSFDRAGRLASSRSEIFNAVNPSAPIVSVTAIDAKTLTIKLKQPVYHVLGMLAGGLGGRVNIVPKETDSSFDIRRDIIGTGPFVLANYAPSAGFTLKRNPEYFETDGRPYVDQIDMPVVSEYATAVAQFKAGNIYTYDIRGEDIFQLKRDVPELNVFQVDISILSGLSVQHTGFGWLPEGRSPFLDERVRQAASLSIDRELWLDTVYNVASFRSQGLPVETKWNSSVLPVYEGWLDPRSRDFGPNGKYFEHSVEEAKKLLAAAGYPNGLDVTSTAAAGLAYGPDYPRNVAITEGMLREAGFRPIAHFVDYTSEFIPKYRPPRGDMKDGRIRRHLTPAMTPSRA